MIKIIGLTGNIAGGKGVVAEYLKTIGYKYFSLSEQVRAIAKRTGREGALRAVLQNIGNQTRSEFGSDIFARLVGADILALKANLVVVDGIRNPAEVGFFRLCSCFCLIAVTAKKENRFEWMMKRARESDPKTWDEFIEMDARDLGTGENSTGQQVGACIEMADFILPNFSTKESMLYRANLIARGWWKENE